MSTIIDKLYLDNLELMKYLETNGQISFRSDFDDMFKKVLLLSCASFFENRIIEIIINFITKKTNYNTPLITFVQSKAINRQYHTYFSWKETNVNQFLSSFGEDFKKEFLEEIKNTEIPNSIKAFMEIGRDRNLLVHQNFANYYLNKTSEEIYILYTEAIKFVEYLENKLS